MHNYVLSLEFPTKRANCFPQKIFRRKFHISHFVRSQKMRKFPIFFAKFCLGKQNAKNLRKKYGRESFFAQLIFQLQITEKFSQKNFEKSVYVKFSIVLAFFRIFHFREKMRNFANKFVKCEMKIFAFFCVFCESFRSLETLFAISVLLFCMMLKTELMRIFLLFKNWGGKGKN